MRKLSTIAALLATFMWSGVSAAGVQVDWVQPTRGNSLAVDADDNVYTVDYEYNPAGDIYLTKRDAMGAFLWTEKFDQTENTVWERASWVATDGLGNAIVCGTLMSGYSNPVTAASILMKFAPDGQLLWRRVYEGSFDGSFTKKCLVDEGDNIYVLGMGSGEAGFVTKVKKFGPDGTALWSYFDAAGIGAPINFKFSADGGIVIAARALFGSINGYAKIDRDGNHIWSHPGVQSLTAGDAAGDIDGNTYLVHGDYPNNGGSVIRKISPTGSLLWSSVYSLVAYRVEVGSDQQPVICGFPNSGSGGAAFLKADPNGGVVWSNFDADGPLALLLHAQLLVDRNDNIYLAAGTLFEMAVCQVASNGASAWTALTSGSYAQGIALGRHGDVYVVGGSTAKLVEVTAADAPEPASSRATGILAQSYPNPCGDQATIRYQLPQASEATLTLYDASGRELRTFASGLVGMGEQSVRLDTRDLSAGVYLYQLRHGSEVERRVLTIVR